MFLLFGVPQRSVIGPVLFIIYTLPLARTVHGHGIQIHVYANDTQPYVSYDVTDIEHRHDVTVQLEKCINDLQSWMVTNKLKLNGSKTELVVLVSSHFSKRSSDLQVKIDKNLVSPSVFAKNRGVFLDQN